MRVKMRKRKQIYLIIELSVFGQTLEMEGKILTSEN